MDRRTFLRAGLAGAAGFALSACRGGGRGDASELAVFPGGADFAAGLESYFALGIRDAAGDPVSGPVDVTFRSGARRIEAGRTAWFPYARAESDGPEGVHALTVRFPSAGIWDVDVSHSSGARGTAALTVKERASAPIPGDRAKPTLTPTTGDARGVSPICTRKPPCPLHELTLADALRSGRPVAFFIGSPAFCTSQTCGPNLDELLAVRDEVGARARFVHAEVYIDDDPDSIRRRRLAPAMLEWTIPTEPWLFLIGADGRIARRFEGPVTAPQIEEALSPLL